ncbi:MAG: DUF5020 family protein [Prolixibacteraceae bacterium]|nr:DUF5020 family protein [Prolixibacteraceae bacterium]
MKKVIIVSILLVAGLKLFSQNLQLHYDFGEGRHYITSTIERFAPDLLGSTYYFVDFNYDKNGPTEAYWEISRELKKWDAPLTVHIEYNGGLHTNLNADDDRISFQINNAYLAGGTYTWNADDFSKGISFTAMYKYIQGNPSPHNYQVTTVWYLNLLKGKISLSGFADFWHEEQAAMGTSFIFLSEPQFWFNLNRSFSVGGEVELGYNFAGVKGFKACPTLGAKWTM